MTQLAAAVSFSALPADYNQRIEQAAVLGAKAQARGLQQVPALDAELMPLLVGLAVGQGVPVMQAWTSAHIRSQEVEQIRAFAAHLDQVPEVEQRLATLADNAALATLWWELFNQLPDAE